MPSRFSSMARFYVPLITLICVLHSCDTFSTPDWYSCHMGTLLVKNTAVLVTMDDQRREIADGAIFVRDNVIEAVGRSADLPQTADEVLNLAGHLVMPGLINTHHHMYQSLTRVYPGG